jgi:hypothetical protein
MMNKYIKSLLFSIGITLIVWVLMSVFGSPTIHERTIPAEGRWSPQQTVQEKTYPKLPPIEQVLPIAFAGSYLIGLTIFRNRESK